MPKVGLSAFFAGTILVAAISWVHAQSPAESVPFSLLTGSAASFVSDETLGPLSIGFARILRADPFTVTPEGFAILQFRPHSCQSDECRFCEGEGRILKSERRFPGSNG